MERLASLAWSPRRPGCLAGAAAQSEERRGAAEGRQEGRRRQDRGARRRGRQRQRPQQGRTHAADRGRAREQAAGGARRCWQGASPDVADKDARTALLEACKRGSGDVARALVGAKADVNLADKDGNTALMEASKKDDAALVALLVRAAPTWNAADDDGWTALLEAAQKGRLRSRWSSSGPGANLESRIERGSTALLLAAGNGHAALAAPLIDAGADFNAATARATRCCCWPPIRRDRGAGRAAPEGGRPGRRGGDRRQRLQRARRRGRERQGRRGRPLLDARANPNREFGYQRLTPLMLAAKACKNGPTSTCAPGGPRRLPAVGRPHRAQLRRRVLDSSVVTDLLMSRRRAGRPSRTTSGRTALMRAAARGHQSTVDAILFWGKPKLDVRDRDGKHGAAARAGRQAHGRREEARDRGGASELYGLTRGQQPGAHASGRAGLGPTVARALAADALHDQLAHHLDVAGMVGGRRRADHAQAEGPARAPAPPCPGRTDDLHVVGHEADRADDDVPRAIGRDRVQVVADVGLEPRLAGRPAAALVRRGPSARDPAARGDQRRRPRAAATRRRSRRPSPAGCCGP